MKKYRIVHTTEYRFDSAVRDFKLTARLHPIDSIIQQCEFFQLACRPPFDHMENRKDRFGNHLTLLNVHPELQRLSLSANSTVSVDISTSSNNSNHIGQPDQCFIQPTQLVVMDETIKLFAHQVVGLESRPFTAASVLSKYIFDNFCFSTGDTSVHTTAPTVLRERKGVCQDFAHLAIAALRSIGFAARYASGYLHTAAFREPNRGLLSDVSHAWFEVYDTGLGWLGFDPTNGRSVDDNYIIVATGRDYKDICPLQGAYEGDANQWMDVTVDVQQTC